MGNSLITSATLQCPHGGVVQIVSSNTRVKATSTPMATSADTFIVAGCPFQLAGPVPSPCLSVKWIVTDMRVKVGGPLALSTASQGLCLNAAQLPQGPVTIASTQAKVKSQ
jgi:hypothetical protein